jgi:hypothetical protein
MHGFKHGELKSGPGGKGGKVKSRRRALAIALSESGTSKYDSPRERRHNLARSKKKEARGETAQQEKQGKARVSARGQRESSPAMGGKHATRPAMRRGGARRGRSKRSGSRSRAGKRNT